MNVEKETQKLERELKAIKTSFEQSAATMKIYKTQIRFSTSPNQVRWNSNGHWEPLKYEPLDSLAGLTSDSSGNYTGYGHERIVVTFDSEKGQNTFASLELNLIDFRNWIVWPKRVPYSGGARWVVDLHPNVYQDEQYVWHWKPNILDIAIESSFPGVVGAKMIWD